MNDNFRNKLIGKIIESIPNNYKDNYDAFRFGKNLERKQLSIKRFIIEKFLKPKLVPLREVRNCFESLVNLLDNYEEELEKLYRLLEDERSRNLLIDIIAYRILGESKVKFSLNNNEYRERILESYNYADKKDYIDIKFLNWRLYKTSFHKYNLPLSMYTMPPAMVIYGFLGQYEYRLVESCRVCPGDIVLDCGGCYGDTALIFGYHAGRQGMVFSFEFIPSNIEIFERNLALNNHNVSNVQIIGKPLWDESGKNIYFKDNGPGSRVTADPFPDMDGNVSTISIDDFVNSRALSKVDFIKMDIEGAELPSLKGALDTLTKHKPKLAISVYHSMNDFIKIPEYLNSLELGYRFFLGHYTIHAEETVLYAIV